MDEGKDAVPSSLDRVFTSRLDRADTVTSVRQGTPCQGHVSTVRAKVWHFIELITYGFDFSLAPASGEGWRGVVPDLGWSQDFRCNWNDAADYLLQQDPTGLTSE